MKTQLRNPWVRLAIALAAAWIVIACGLYFPPIGSTNDPSWLILWYHFFPLWSQLFPYELTCPRLDLFNPAPCLLAFSAAGFAAFLAYPVLVLSLLTALVAWITRGFRARGHSA